MKIHQWRNWFFFLYIFLSFVFHLFFTNILFTFCDYVLKVVRDSNYMWLWPLFDLIARILLLFFFFDFFCTFLNVTGIDHALDYHRYYLSWITFDYVRLCSIVLHLMEEQTYKQQQNIHELQYKPRGVKVIRVRYLFQPSQ